MILDPQNIPGFQERLDEARLKLAKDREASFMGRSHSICGIPVRAMTVYDFTVLSNMKNASGGIGSPLLFKGNPTLLDVSMFIWILQPSMPAYKKLSFRWWRARSFGRMMAKLMGTEKSREKVGLSCLAYVDAMLSDAPSISGKSASESCISFLASWCNAMRSAYNCTEEEVLWTDLPKFFQYVRAMSQSTEPDRAQANKMVDDLFQKVCDMINCGVSVDDIMSGKAPIPSL